jgi:hypothetical protein
MLRDAIGRTSCTSCQRRSIIDGSSFPVMLIHYQAFRSSGYSYCGASPVSEDEHPGYCIGCVAGHPPYGGAVRRPSELMGPCSRQQ